METITNAASSVATTVSKTIWGDQNPQNPTPGNETAGREPISGVEGKGTATEPFDQGNADTATTSSTSKLTSETPTTSSSLTSSTPTTSEAPATSSSLPKLTPENPTTSSSFASSTPTTNEATSTGRKDAADSISPNTNNASNAGATDPLQTTDKTGASSALSNPTKGSDVIPSESQHPGVAPTSGSITHQKQQGADRPDDTPSAEEKGAITSKTDEAESVLQKRDPNDHSGEPMKMHTGDSTTADTGSEWDERRESKAGNLGGKEHGKEHGTGDEWVKTSGLAAEGGDFDATKPGAGKEANRLFEEKGLTKSAAGEEPKSTGKGSFDAPSHASAASGEKEKVPLKEKVKQKLHIGSHKKE